MPLGLKLRLDQILFRRLYKAQKQFQSLGKGQSGWRMEQKDPAIKDLFSNLLEARDPITLSALTEEELIAEAGVLIVAGSDTVATNFDVYTILLPTLSPNPPPAPRGDSKRLC